MADTLENASFWLPTNFLTDDDLLSLNTKPITHQHQPHPFSSLHSPTPTEPDNNDDYDNELLAELTRYLSRFSLNHSHLQGCAYSTSPQSTLTGMGPWSSNRGGFSYNGSPTGPSTFPSPPLTPTNQNAAASELLYEAAASHLARLKPNSLSLSLPRHQLSSLNSHPQVRRNENSAWQQDNRRSYGGGVSEWGPQREKHPYTQKRTEGMTAVVLGGGSGGIKKRSSGTGVFIPRRTDSGTHHNQPQIPIARKKSSGCSTVLLPERVVQALNLNVDELKKGAANYNNTPKRVLSQDEIMVARRNAVMSMQRRTGRVEGGRGATVTKVWVSN